ncbi:MAG: hypothetical protein DMG97_44025, partial [Acidobacteria bacterium]
SISNRQLLRDSRHVRDWLDRVFLAIGTKETRRKDKDQEVVDDVRAFTKVLRRAGLSDRRLLLKIDEGAIHDESAWASRLPEALTFLFGR